MWAEEKGLLRESPGSAWQGSSGQSELSCLSEPVSVQAGFCSHFNYGIIFVEGEILCERLFVSFFFF